MISNDKLEFEGYTETELQREHFTMEEWVRFQKFITGQPVGEKDGQKVYFKGDVERFKELLKVNAPETQVSWE